MLHHFGRNQRVTWALESYSFIIKPSTLHHIYSANKSKLTVESSCRQMTIEKMTADRKSCTWIAGFHHAKSC